jgi:copper chaperone CopZ
MNTLKLNTNLHCSSCVNKLTPVINADKRIESWQVDLKATGTPITVKGYINEPELIALVAQAGYKASATQTNMEANCQMPPIKKQANHFAADHTPVLPTTQFWGDNGVWKRASFNTLNCLIGCSIGDFAMIIFLQAYYPQTSMFAQMILATLLGLITSVLLETSILHYREKMVWGASLKMALSMSFISMVAMEIAMNFTDFMITGGKLMLTDPAYWLAFIPAAIAGFLVPLPYNYYKLKKYNKACH